MLCSGNLREFCGAGSLLNVYKDMPDSVSSDGTANTVNSPNEGVIVANTTVPGTGKSKREAFVERVKLRWERALS